MSTGDQTYWTYTTWGTSPSNTGIWIDYATTSGIIPPECLSNWYPTIQPPPDWQRQISVRGRPYREEYEDYNRQWMEDQREIIKQATDRLKMQAQKEKDRKEKSHPMKNLYEVIVVSTDEKVLFQDRVVAEDADEAKFLVDIHSVLKSEGLKPKDVTILCLKLGEIKVKKPTQKVKIVKEEDSD